MIAAIWKVSHRTPRHTNQDNEQTTALRHKNHTATPTQKQTTSTRIQNHTGILHGLSRKLSKPQHGFATLAPAHPIHE